jgi:hypothetical protein
VSVIIYLRSGTPIGFPRAAAVSYGTLPARPDETPAKAVQVVTSTGEVLGMFRLKETAGHTINDQPAP